MAEKAISLPFRIDPFGKIAMADTQEKIWADRVRGVLGTTFRERLLRPEFGSSLVESLFEQSDNSQLDIESQVEEAFNNFLPDLSLTSVVVTETPSNGELSVEITYELPNQKETSVNIGYIQIQGAFPPYEQLVAYQERINE